MIYRYEGAVMEFGKLVQNDWRAETTADSPQKARSNLAYRWKLSNNRVGYSKVTLPGKLYLKG